MTMYRDNVVLFAKAAADKPALRERLAATDSPNDWLEIAHEAGFEFAIDDFTSIVSAFLGRAVDPEMVVHEFRAAQRTLGDRPLVRAMFKRFIGGVTRTCDFWVAGLPEEGQPPVGETGR